MIRFGALAVLLMLNAGCYTVSLRPIAPVPGQLFPLSAMIEIPAETAGYTHDVRSFAAGFANRFRIRVGRALSQYADAYLGQVFRQGDDVRIEISIEGFDVYDFEAHIDARFRIMRAGGVRFDKKYHANGGGYFARVVWGGAFAMKSSMRKTTDEALRSLFEQFLGDVAAGYAAWVVPDLEVPVEELSATPATE